MSGTESQNDRLTRIWIT